MAFRPPTIENVRERFSALGVPVAFFDGPGGTQAPDSVIEAISSYLQAANANVGGAWVHSLMTGEVVNAARQAASHLVGGETDEFVFGANTTTLNFALSRTAGREWEAGDEVVVTRLDHDANVAPWLELAHDRGLVVRFCELDGECRLDLDHLRSLLTERTRVVAFPWASNAVGTVTPVAEIAGLAREAGALSWVDAVHYAPHGPIDVAAAGVDVLLCSPYKFFGPHLGLAYARRELLEGWRPYKVRPAPELPVGHRHETGTQAFELLCGFVAAVEYLQGVGWHFIGERERALGQRFLDGLPDAWTLHGPPTMEGRVSTFAITHADETPEAAAGRLAEAGFALWHGNYYALEVMRHLGLEDGGALRVGIVHYNTEDEVDRLLAEL